MKKSKRFIGTVIAVMLGAAFCMSVTACESSAASSYSITVNQGITGGTVTADKTKVSAGDDVVLSLQVNDGMVLEYVTVNGIEVSFYDGKYTLFSVDEDYVIDAKFVSSKATVSFVTGTDETFEPKSAVLYESVGELPVPAQSGSRKFLGWYDAEEGGNLIKRSSLVKTNELVLYAHWETLSQEYLDGLIPYSITSTVYSSQLGAYGISFHTLNASLDPQILIAETTDPDFSEAVTVDCTQEFFYEEYVSQGVIDLDGLSLSRGKDYLVKVGDSTAGVFSDSFTFRARQLEDGAAKFVYVTDTQQDYHDRYYTKVDETSYPNGIEDNFAATLLKTAIAKNSDFDFIAHGGDFVNYGAENGYWAEMLGDLTDIMFEYPMIAAAGNHESPNYYACNKFNLMASIFNVNTPDFGTSAAETYVRNGMSGYAFSLDVGPLHFIVLNSNDVYYTNDSVAPSAESLSNAQLNWLRADLKAYLANDETKFAVTMIHEGPLVPTHSSNVSNDHYKGLRGPLLKELRAGQVDLLLCGHNHYAFSTYPLDYDENASTTITYSSALTVEEKYAKIVTKSYSQETVNGTEFNTFTDYTSGLDGTICMEIGAGGPQNTETTFPLATVQELLTARVFYRSLISTGKNCIAGMENKTSNMYSYIRITDAQLTVETYAANFNDNYGRNFAGGDKPTVQLVDSLLLKK